MYNEIIYFLMLDRFNQGHKEKSFNDMDKSHPRKFHGGDLKGLIQRLDYIKDLGATAIWITPIYKNDPNGYHGYWAQDFYEVDSHFGTMDEFKELIRKAHQKGLKVLLDIVVNHTGKTHKFLEEKKKWYHPMVNIRDWDNQKEVEDRCLAMLPDLNQDIPEVTRYLIDMCKWWVTETGLDGFRIDTVKHVPRWFWAQFCEDIKEVKEDIILIGEVWHPDPSYLAVYQKDGVSSLVDFPLYYAIDKVFAQDAPMDKILSVLVQDYLYKDANVLGTFIDNHDVPRFLHNTKNNGEERLKLALAFLFSFRGVPIIYYGTEVAMEGADDPDNRRDMNFEANPQFREYVKGLIKVRKDNPLLYLGDTRVIKVTDDGLVFVREYNGKQIVVCINNSFDPQSFVIRLPDWLSGEIWKPIWGDGKHSYHYGVVTCEVPQKGAVFFRVI